jgi:hypothetical protein
MPSAIEQEQADLLTTGCPHLANHVGDRDAARRSHWRAITMARGGALPSARSTR